MPTKPLPDGSMTNVPTWNSRWPNRMASSRQARADQTKAAEKAKSLEAEIWKLYEPVAKKEKQQLAKAREAESAAAATIQQATDQRHLLQSRLQNMTGGGCHVDRLRQARFQQQHEARQQESDRSMALLWRTAGAG